MEEFVLIMFIVFTFSIVQSIFGVGVLVFGTPTCLLLGYPFEETLSYLLPASISISCMQVLHGKNEIKLNKEFSLFTIPFIIIGLTLVLMKCFHLDIKILVGLMLILTGTIRLFSKIQKIMERFLRKQMILFLTGMGLIHGLSNMGGGLLTILSSSLFQDKREIRANIAYGYLIFATTQITVLAILNPSLFRLNIIVFPFISLLTYVCLGNSIFLKSREKMYHHLITVFIFTYGLVLLFPN